MSNTHFLNYAPPLSCMHMNNEMNLVNLGRLDVRMQLDSVFSKSVK